MNKVEVIAAGTNYSVATVGKIDELGEHKLVLAPGVEIPGKVFVGNALQATGGDVSFQSFAVGAETGFYHTHKTHEELYIFVKGEGEFQVDGENVKIGEGSVVRVAPDGKRTVRNTGKEPLVMICVQYKANTMTEADATDGVILNEKVEW